MIFCVYGPQQLGQSRSAIVSGKGKLLAALLWRPFSIGIMRRPGLRKKLQARRNVCGQMNQLVGEAPHRRALS